ncbi:MAG: hypothetical protein LBV34_07965, partial [Nocardiopsaceae bacterium]|nr:hypothetical protein [Nocardiopsaceae bacterium]
VRAYFDELDTALRGLPAEQARELIEQITAHVDDALPPDADDEQITAVLNRLGSPSEFTGDLAEAAAPPRVAIGMTRAWLRARLARVRRRTWYVVGVIVVLAGVLTGYLVYYLTPADLFYDGVAGWWYRQDYTRAVDTTADAVTQTTVPIRSGQRQGYFIAIYNETDVTQTIVGPAYGEGVPSSAPGSGAGVAQISVSVPNRNIDKGGASRSVRFSLPGEIPPHHIRLVRVLWTSNVCLSDGADSITDTLSVRVRIGWFTRTETIPLYEGWAVEGPSGPCS